MCWVLAVVAKSNQRGLHGGRWWICPAPVEVAAQGKGSSLKRDVETLQLSEDTKFLFAGHLGSWVTGGLSELVELSLNLICCNNRLGCLSNNAGESVAQLSPSWACCKGPDLTSPENPKKGQLTSLKPGQMSEKVPTTLWAKILDCEIKQLVWSQFIIPRFPRLSFLLQKCASQLCQWWGPRPEAQRLKSCTVLSLGGPVGLLKIRRGRCES